MKSEGKSSDKLPKNSGAAALPPQSSPQDTSNWNDRKFLTPNGIQVAEDGEPIQTYGIRRPKGRNPRRKVIFNNPAPEKYPPITEAKAKKLKASQRLKKNNQ